jgi:hypothetical protein
LTPTPFASSSTPIGRFRARNKLYYRFNHWPIWIFVFFIAPGPLTFDLFERGFDQRLLTWLGVVLLGTGIAGLFGKLPGCEPRPTSFASRKTGRTLFIAESATPRRGAK